MGIKGRKHPNNHHFYSTTRVGEGIALSYLSSDWMADQFIIEPREAQFLEYKEQATMQYQDLIEGFSNSKISSIGYARELGVQREWEVYKFFANDDMNAPKELFSYVDDHGNIRHFSDDQINQIANWQKSDPYPISGIQGHHMELVRDNPSNTYLAANPDNILFATDNAHREFLHDGNTKNPTNEDYFPHAKSMDEQFEMTIQYNQDLITLDLFESGLVTAGGSAALYGSISMMVKWYQLKNDPMNWNRKSEELIKTGMAASLLGGSLSTVGYLTTISIDGLFADFTPAMLEHFFSEMLATNSSFFAIAAAGGLIRFVRDVRNGKNIEQAKNELQAIMMVAAAEFLAFSALGVGIDVLADFAADTLLDAFIPDPTGVLIAIRVAYNLFKFGKTALDANQNKEAVKHCVKLRHEYFYKHALLDNKLAPQLS